MKTIDRICAFLADEDKFLMKAPALFPDRGFDVVIIRDYFETSNGHKVSIQQSASHYCSEDSVEMWMCPHHPMLDKYRTDDESPYGWVPLDVVAQYIDAIEQEV